MAKYIWIDKNVLNEENSKDAENLEKNLSIEILRCRTVEEAINLMKTYHFIEIKIIVSGRLYLEFVSSFKENLINMCIAPKIIIYTSNVQRFLERNKEYKNVENEFYNIGGIATIIDEVENFLKNEEISSDQFDTVFTTQSSENTFSPNSSAISFTNGSFSFSDEPELVFEYIDGKDKLILPLFFKALIDNISNDNMREYTNSIYNSYSKKSDSLKELLDPIISLSNIPVEILSKYYARLYTLPCSFHKNLNKDLRLNQKDKYLPYIKTLYEGVKLKSLPLANDKELYRCSKLSIEEIKNIDEYLNKKIEGLPSSIVFSKSFLSFSKTRVEAEKFFQHLSDDKNYCKVLFILEKNDSIGYNLSTHGDIEKISYYPKEGEVLFFPFSSFEIKEKKEIEIESEKGYEIKLLYLGKYLKDIKEDDKLFKKENKLRDSKFGRRLSDFGLIDEEKLRKTTNEELRKSFTLYEKGIKNIIIGEINIGPIDINKDIQIINSFENVKRINEYKDKEDDVNYENEKEIKENTIIKINGKLIKFSYLYKFEKEGIYKIVYSFKRNLKKTNHLFYRCNNLISLNLSNFNSQNITNMSNMFNNCGALIYLNLSNFNTHKVTDMSYMFNNCGALTNLDLTNFDIQKVINMGNMFSNCRSLTKLNFSNLNTKSNINTFAMFDGCKSLHDL